MEDLENAYKSASNAEGSALKENATYLDSIQGRVDLFTNALQTMWMNLISSDAVKFFVDSATALVRFFDSAIGKVTVLGTLVAGLYGKNKLDKQDISLSDFIFDIAPEKVKDVTGITEFISNVQKIFASEMKKINAHDLLAELANYDDVSDDAMSGIMEALGISGENVLSALVSERQVSEVLDGFDDISDATREAVLSSELFSTSQIGAAAGTDFFTVSLAKAKAGMIAFCQSIKAAAIAHPVLTAIAAIGVAIAGSIAIMDALTISHDEYIEKLDEETEALKTVQGELNNVQTELEKTNARIDELNAKESLSFVEEDELNRLKEQTKELERQERILQAQEKRARSKQIEAALGAASTDENLVRTAKSTVGATYTTYIPNAAYTDMPVITYTDREQALDSNVQNQYEKNLDDLKVAKEDLEKAQKELAKFPKAEGKEYESANKAVEEAQERVKKYNEALDEMNQTWQAEYGDIGYIENATEEYEEQWNEIYRQHQDYLDQQALLNGDYGISTVLERIFGATGTDIAQSFNKDFEKAVKNGKDPAEAIDELLSRHNYSSAFSGLESQFGITLDHIKGYFTKTGEFALTDSSFNISDYTSSISALSSNISTYQEALDSLESGSFTMSDFVALIEQFPELAEGVDVSSKSFSGLSRNLRKAIKESPEDLIDDLKLLKKQLEATGKSTAAIDQLIASIENMPTEMVENMSNKYSTLADKITEAKKAQTELSESMSENPNQGYETRGDAIEYMIDKMKRGEIGSESELWSVAEEYGFSYDSALSINENADALAKFIAVRKDWFKTNDDGEQTFEGTENFIESVEKAVQSSDRLQELLTWDYDETTGKFNFDFDNENLEEIISLLSETDELIGLTSEEWMDLMVQIGQYFGIEWGDYDDVLVYLDKIASGASTATEKLKEYGKAMQEYFGKGTEIDLTNRPIVGQKEMQDAGWSDFNDGYGTVYSSSYSNEDGTLTVTTTPILPDGNVLSPSELEQYTNDIINGADPETYEFEVNGKTYTGKDIVLAKHEGEDSIEQAKQYAEALHLAQEQYQLLQDPLEIETTIVSDGVQGLTEITELQGSIKDGSRGLTIVNTDTLTSVLKEAGYTEDQINKLIAKIKEYQGVVSITDSDPLGLNSENASISTVISSLEELGVQYTVTRGTLSNPGRINIEAPELITVLQEKGWTSDQISSYLQSLTSTENGLGVTVDGKVNMNSDEVDEVIAKANEIPVEKQVVLEVVGDGPEVLSQAVDDLNAFGGNKTAYLTTYEKKYKKAYVWNPNEGQYTETAWAEGTAYSQGTAYKGGHWGAPETENALVGELGPELLVRNGRWTTIGDNGAEFTQIKKGDIIFNHKQTEDLLSKGRIIGRGKAYASGTAYSKTDGMFSSYTIGDGGYVKYDVNGKILDQFGNAVSDAADSASEAADEFKEAFDWIEVRLEELNELLSLRSAQLENQIGSKNQNAVIDDIIDINKKLYENLIAGADQYYSYAEKLLAKVPEEYRDQAQNGTIAITEFTGEVGEEALNAIQEYRDWVQKGADATQQAEEVLTEIRSLAKQAFDNIAQEYDNKTSFNDIKIDQFDAYNSLLETDKGFADANIYQAIMKENESKIKLLETQRKDLLNELSNIEYGTQDWYDAVNAIAEVDTEIINLKTDIEDAQDSINELHWQKFDVLMKQFESLVDEADNLIEILGDKDIVDDIGNWTDEGITSIGLLAQQMEIAEMQTQKYKEEIDYLNANWKDLGYTQEEYLDKLDELKSGQYDAIKLYNKTKDAIVDLNKERVEAIKEGIEKEIEAYEELIEKKKEELDAEKDLHDFQKSVMDQQKDIADIERKLAALSGDNSSSARAQRAKLEAELYEARAELEETYYDRSVSHQQEALDNELENFRDEKDAEMESWDKYLENTNTVVSDSLDMVQQHTQIVYETLQDMGREYGINVAGTLSEPWKEGESAIQSFSEKFGLSISTTVDELKKLETEFAKTMLEIEQLAKNATTTIDSNLANYTSVKEPETPKEPVKETPKETPKEEPKVEQKQIQVGGKIDASGAKIYSYAGDTNGLRQYFSSDPIYVVLEEKNGYLKVRHHKSSSGATGWFKKSDVKAYAKGTTGVYEDQWALLHELGEELVLSAGPNGKLQYITRGTAVIPHDISENLMKLGQLDPSEVLSRNVPQIGASPSVVNNTMEIHMDIAEVVHIDTVTNDTIPDLTKAVRKEMDSYMLKVNNAIKTKVR